VLIISEIIYFKFFTSIYLSRGFRYRHFKVAMHLKVTVYSGADNPAGPGEKKGLKQLVKGTAGEMLS